MSEKAQTKEIPEWQRKVAFATNAAGAVAGPAAIAMAIRQAREKQGGMPRAATEALQSKFPKSGAFRRVGRVMRHPATVAVGGVTGVGLQAANWTGDAIAASALKKQPKEKASKSMDGDIEKMTYGAVGRFVRTRDLKRMAELKESRNRVAQEARKKALEARVGKSFEQSVTDVYISKAARGTGHGKSLDDALDQGLSKDPSIDQRYDRMREKDMKTNGRMGAAAGGLQGGMGGGALGAVPGYLKGKPKMMGLGAAGGALAGGLALGAVARNSARTKVKRVYDDPAVEYQVKRNMGLSDAAKRALERRRAAQEAALSKRYFDAEADRQRRLGTYAGLGAGGAIALGTGAATQLEGAKIPMADRGGKKAFVIRSRKGKSGKLGAALAGGAALSALAGGAAYKRGISERNQPWS